MLLGELHVHRVLTSANCTCAQAKFPGSRLQIPAVVSNEPLVTANARVGGRKALGSWQRCRCSILARAAAEGGRRTGTTDLSSAARTRPPTTQGEHSSPCSTYDTPSSNMTLCVFAVAVLSWFSGLPWKLCVRLSNQMLRLEEFPRAAGSSTHHLDQLLRVHADTFQVKPCG